MTFSTPLGRLRILALLEGISYLLLFVAMPIKYGLDIPEPNYIVGMAHGLLFILYVIVSLQCSLIHRWGLMNSIIVLVASLLPFGTFYVDKKILKPTQDQVSNQD
ncbi:MAG: DUF3817 domain-containing protein [Cyclobacteriaceae bacterium]